MVGSSTAVASRMPSWARVVVFLLGGTSVASLLAWVYGVGSFRAWFLAVSLPGQLVLAGLALWVARRDDLAELRLLLLAGFLGGLVGTVGYDLARVPFVVAGLRVLAPIDSYGVLAAGTAESSQWTGLLGWTYHVTNGVGFGLAYAMIAPRRHWGWGVAWAMVLETATVVSPFASQYALRTDAGLQLVPIAIAYAAHVPYGLAIGLAVQRPERWADGVRPLGRTAVPGLLVAVLAGLVLWLQPWSSGVAAAGRALADGASAVVVDQRFEPEWLRVAPGECATFDNRDEATYEIEAGATAAVLGPGTTEVCFTDPGVHRVRTTDEPYAGGFVIVDEFA